jgi:FAD/FMN-containing dehydrogenase
LLGHRRKRKRRRRRVEMSEGKDVIRDGLAAIVGSQNVLTESATLEKYSRDQSFTPPRKPNYVVRPKTREEIQGIIGLANEQLMPLIPYSSGTDFHGAAVPNQGGILVDLSQMNQIPEYDTHHWWVTVEPGVTFAQLNQKIAKDGFRIPTPLMTPPSASVLTTYVEREPVPAAADFIFGNEQIQTLRVVMPSGDSFTTGNPALEGAPHSSPIGPGLDFYRLFMCAQGTLGIVYQMNVRLIPLPKVQKVFFSEFENVTDAINAIRRIQRMELGLECFVLNNFNLATLIVDEEPSDTDSLKKGQYVGITGAKSWSPNQQQRFDTLRHALPPWTMVVTIPAWARYPEEKVEYQELDLRDLASETGFEIKPSVGGIVGLSTIIEEEMIAPWRMQKKFGYKGTCHGLMFHATGASVQKIEDALCQLAAKYRYSSGDIGIYVQPVERARSFYCIFDLHCNSTNEGEVQKVKALFNEASKTLVNLGAFYDRPYGPWADAMYQRDATYAEYLRKIKAQLDPNNIMNPGKLCF